MIPFQGIARETAEVAPALEPEVRRILAGGQFVHGPEGDRLERLAAADCGRRHAVAVGSGSDALFLALAASGIGPSDEVICPAVSFVATAMSIARTGATPVFVDVEDDAMLDLAGATRALSSRTRAMLFVQLFGATRDHQPLEAWAARHGLMLFEDAAQSYGARAASGRACGSLGLASALSFSPTKVFGAAGNGGAIVTDDAELANRARRMRQHGRENGLSVEFGLNSRLHALAAQALLSKRDHLADWSERRRRIARSYMDACDRAGLDRPSGTHDDGHVWHKYVVYSPDRDRLRSGLRARGIETALHYPIPLHQEPVWADLGLTSARRAEQHAASCLSLPIYAQLTDAEVEHICNSLIEAASGT